VSKLLEIVFALAVLYVLLRFAVLVLAIVALAWFLLRDTKCPCDACRHSDGCQ